MLCSSLRILCFLPSLPLLCSIVFFFVLPGFLPLFTPPGFFRFSLSPLVCFLFQFFPLFFFLVSLYILSVHPLLKMKTMVIKAWGAAGWMEAPSFVFSHFRLCVRLVCLSWFCFSPVLSLCFLSLAFYSQRKPCRYLDNKVHVFAGVMAMHRWTSVFLVWWTEEDDGFFLKRRRAIVNGHLCFGPWSFEMFVSNPLDKL